MFQLLGARSEGEDGPEKRLYGAVVLPPSPNSRGFGVIYGPAETPQPFGAGIRFNYRNSRNAATTRALPARSESPPRHRGQKPLREIPGRGGMRFILISPQIWRNSSSSSGSVRCPAPAIKPQHPARGAKYFSPLFCFPSTLAPPLAGQGRKEEKAK